MVEKLCVKVIVINVVVAVDVENVCFAKKFILDSMVKYKKLSDDNRKIVTVFTDTFEYQKGITKFILEIEEVGE